MSEKKYYDVRNAAYEIALKILRNPDTAEDIAQNVSLKYLQNEDKVEKHIAWSKRVSKNESINYLNKQKKTKLSFQGDLSNAESITKPKNEISVFDMDKEEVKELISKADFRIYKLFVKHDGVVSKIARSLRTKKAAAYNKVFRMKKNLTAAKYLKEGWRGTSKIIDYDVHLKITRFVKKYLKCCNQKDLSSMRRYFQKINIKEIPIIRYIKTVDYGFILLPNDHFRLSLPFVTTENKVDCVFFTLDKDLCKGLKVLKIERPTKVYYHTNPQLVKKYSKPMYKGILTESKEEVMRKIDKLGFKEQK